MNEPITTEDVCAVIQSIRDRLDRIEAMLTQAGYPRPSGQMSAKAKPMNYIELDEAFCSGVPVPDDEPDCQPPGPMGYLASEHNKIIKLEGGPFGGKVCLTDRASYSKAIPVGTSGELVVYRETDRRTQCGREIWGVEIEFKPSDPSMGYKYGGML
jgi:hypothetical protein